EVVRLRLDDIDWREERFRVRQSKSGRESFLPLVASVGEAMLKYLQKDRPQTETREVFLCLRAPYRPFFNGSSLHTVICRRLGQAGIEMKGRHGSHAFRFARAVFCTPRFRSRRLAICSGTAARPRQKST